MRRLTFSLACLLLAACAPQPPEQAPSLEAAIAAPYRSEANRARDVYRHPQETLEFFGLRDDLTVVEVAPGAGWYTEILAPYLRAHGHYIAAGPANGSKASASARKYIADFAAKLKANPELYDRVTVAELGPPDRWQPVKPGTADMVLTFRNVHNWLAAGTEREMFAAFFRSLKPGGVLGVVEHRAEPGTSIEQMRKTGYVTQDFVVQLAKDAGFRFVAWEDINANPKDTKNYPEGVWTLPPTLKLGEQDKAKYLTIGESDRMTLRFIKPIP